MYVKNSDTTSYKKSLFEVTPMLLFEMVSLVRSGLCSKWSLYEVTWHLTKNYQWKEIFTRWVKLDGTGAIVYWLFAWRLLFQSLISFCYFSVVNSWTIQIIRNVRNGKNWNHDGYFIPLCEVQKFFHLKKIK